MTHQQTLGTLRSQAPCVTAATARMALAASAAAGEHTFMLDGFRDMQVTQIDACYQGLTGAIPVHGICQ